MKTPNKKIHFRKRHFQLLELMIAMFILLICLAPTLRIFNSMYLSQHAVIRENQRDHLTHLIHAKITEQLYKRTMSLEDLRAGKTITLEDEELSKLLKKYDYKFTGSFAIVEMEKKREEEKSKKCLGKLLIKIKDISPQAEKNAKFFNEKPLFDDEIISTDPTEKIYVYLICINLGHVKEEGQQSAIQTDRSVTYFEAGSNPLLFFQDQKGRVS